MDAVILPFLCFTKAQSLGFDRQHFRYFTELECELVDKYLMLFEIGRTRSCWVRFSVLKQKMEEDSPSLFRRFAFSL